MKSLKNLLIPLIILGVLILAVVLVFVFKPKDDEKTDDSKYQLLLLAPEDVNRMTVSGNGNELIFYFNEGQWFIEGVNADVGISEDAIKTYISLMLDYNANTKLDVKDPNLSEYGLDADNAYKILIEKKDGSLSLVTIGNMAPDNTNCYIMVDGDPSVYMIASIKRSMCAYEPINFYNTIQLDVDFSTVEKIYFDRKADDTSLEMVPRKTESGYTFDIVEPFATGTSDQMTLLLNDIKSLEIASFVKMDDAKKAEVGLDDPSYHFKFVNTDGTTEEFYLSSLQNEVYYGYGSVSDECFTLSSQQLSYLDTPIELFISRYIHYITASEVKTITGVINGKNFEFSIDTENSISQEDADVLLDGRNAKIFNSKGRCYAGVFFETLATIEIGGIDSEATPSGDSVMDIQILGKDYVVTKISFIQRGDASYYCMINGEYSGFYVNANELFKDGEDNFYAYGIAPAYDLLTTAISDNLNGVYDLPTED